ncbi:hypothetical protein AZI86_11885 [Bdellovibrio bacteriovorus]|uniref:Outer membrane protein beta-barrel domain-containing protein n=1 Tax=Bdellovibrio bacteriovorus TaxID=959 RepID=A0A150WMF6_BDEBC|nr:hypothetical protein [Bdellovibrio bacteriovorus]KYG64893.1 hypothetical protein AZI86_11885 [Bdellovibrio bacteriovorus]
MSLKNSLLISLLCLLTYSTSFAAFVTTVKGNKVLINLEGDPVDPEDEFFLINPETNKKTAIIRIKQVKGNRALADIIKGRAGVNQTLQAKGTANRSRPMSADVTDPGAPDSASSPAPSASGRYTTMIKESYGLMGSLNMNSMSANVTYRDPVGTVLKSSTDMKGNGFGVGGFYDYPFTDTLVGHAYAAIEQFVVSGSAANAACSGSTNCEANINYLSVYGLAKWYFLPGKYRSWAGGGAGFLLALSKSSSALNESQISTNQVFSFAGGVDIQMSRQNFIPVSLQYNMFPDSSSVKASQIIIKAGWGWNL